ncbi:tRNA wybutosine-synthesizing protein 3 homolog isoform X3 [Xiphophorus couchianus]|uniref:tRNA wybutosine-synthesizing protein 3 homolog isoform X3 n=1 Tax=Xiphophorus couchianus TaxID=32473 RepID=UPI0010168B2B|nr:tRNA wybutosine-synthesizing protein 3 homolog isoform X3 [Xiphophorus couchianus]
MDRTFSRIKTQSLNRLDLSKKGSVDEDIEHVVSLLNSCEQFFTTSSCSGRIILIDGMSGLSRACGDAVLKFEPFVLHVQCRRLEDAQLLHSVAVNSGFRNSGLTVGKTGKIVSAVRSTHGLEVPLSRHGKLLVDEDYIQFLTQIANQKMEENLRRVQRFFQNFQSAVSAERQHIPDSPGTQEHQVSQHTHKKGRRGEQGTNKQNQLNVNKRRHQHETVACHDYGDSSLPELNDCLDLFT